jgi:hypothetical protein
MGAEEEEGRRWKMKIKRAADARGWTRMGESRGLRERGREPWMDADGR